MFDVQSALRALVEAGGSDLHLKGPSPPLIRVDGELRPLPGTAPLTPQDSEVFARALRRGLRQAPDVILMGEMCDAETVRTALSDAETGHLVFSTLHTVDAA